jgi:hypothetical protein|tara:strand:+ start:1675 stop:1917 length:243 start_codon:yes stop_codon:yes gene_type:complete
MSNNEYENWVAFDLEEIKLLSKAKKLLQLRIDAIDQKIDKLAIIDKKQPDIRIYFPKSQCIKCNMIASIIRDSTCYHCII